MTTGTTGTQTTNPAPRPAAFELSRVFDAPRDLVWKAWTQAEHLKKWWGPKGCTIPACTLDLKPGGTFHYCMRFPNGHEMWGRWTFDTIIPPELLEFTSCFSDPQGNPTHHPMSPDWPLHMPGRLEFMEEGNKTRLKMQVFLDQASEIEKKTFEEGRGGFHQGCNSTWDQLGEYLASVRS